MYSTLSYCFYICVCHNPSPLNLHLSTCPPPSITTQPYLHIIPHLLYRQSSWLLGVRQDKYCKRVKIALDNGFPSKTS